MSSVILSMLLFALGGWGGAINASFGMNAVIHNTSWVPGHFHTTVGSASALTFMGTCYVVVPRLLGRRLELAPMARVQPWIWFLGMLPFSIPTHLTGLMGMPRRVFDPSYANHPTAVSWQWLTNLSAIGGIVLFASALFFVLVMLFTLFGPRVPAQRIEFSEPLEDPGTKGAFSRSARGADRGGGTAHRHRVRVSDLAPPPDAAVRIAGVFTVLKAGSVLLTRLAKSRSMPVNFRSPQSRLPTAWVKNWRVRVIGEGLAVGEVLRSAGGASATAGRRATSAVI